MAEQYHVELDAEPIYENGRYALWVIPRDQLESMLTKGHFKTWSLRLRTERDPKEESYHPTARPRQTVPAPMKKFFESADTRAEAGRVLYHGCGRDFHGLAALSRSGRDAVEGYDPHHPDSEFRKFPKGKFDEVFSIYTLNVVPVGMGTNILCEMANALKKNGRAVIAVRRDL